MKKIQASGEEYLKWILRLEQKLGYVRNIDLANTMCYSKASITLAFKQLVRDGYVTRDEKNHFHLTEAGREIAENMDERHHVLTALFKAIGVDHATAEADACRVEHVITEETFQKIKQLYFTDNTSYSA